MLALRYTTHSHYNHIVFFHAKTTGFLAVSTVILVPQYAGADPGFKKGMFNNRRTNTAHSTEILGDLT